MSASDISTRYQRLFQYFWDPEPRNDDPTGQSIRCLGRSYPPTYHHTEPEVKTAMTPSPREVEDPGGFENVEKPTTSQVNAEAEVPWPSAFLDDFEARFWFTYRNEFTAIPRSTDAALTFSVRLRNLGESAGFTSDTGWGCMIRSGQCLLSNALSLLWLGRDWRRGQRSSEEKRLLSLFADDPRAPFSIHKFVEHGASACGKHPGEWFGPSATAQCIEALARNYSQIGLKVYVAHDGAQVYEGSVLRLAEGDGDFNPVLILAGIRLGIDRITPVYRQALQSVLAIKQTIGIAGGRPSASHYFVASQGDHFFYLDPHHPRAALAWHEDPGQYSDEDVDSCHTRRLRRLSIDKMDPSMLLAFVIQSRNDFDDWKRSMAALPGNSILNMATGEPPGDTTLEREDAVDEVEAFDDEDMDGEPEIVAIPQT